MIVARHVDGPGPFRGGPAIRLAILDHFGGCVVGLPHLAIDYDL
jgi:hypothetical protein